MFNIFNILSVADKELVHSSMIKLLIDEKELKFPENFLKIANYSGNLKLEVKQKITGKSLRLDIVGFGDSENNYKFIIENKFKSTPTINQLRDYDTIKEINNTKKFLLVFSDEQVPIDVQEHCKKKNWEILSYFNFEDSQKNNLSLTEILPDLPKLKDNKKQYLITEYQDYLLSIKNDLLNLFKDERLLNSKDIDSYFKKNNIQNLKIRDIKFRYLLHIQALLSKNISNLAEMGIITANDGGARPIPSVPFWKKNFMFTIDGDSLKIGFYYNHAKHNIATKLKIALIEALRKYPSIIEEYSGKVLNNNSIKNDKTSSVISLVSFDLKIKKWGIKSDFINAATVIFNTYYKIYHDQQDLINQL